MRDLERMLVVANTDWFIAHFMSSFLTAHARVGIRVITASPPGPYTRALQQAGFEWIELPMSRGRGSVRSNLGTVTAIAGLRRRTAPDLVHLITGKAVVLGNLAGDARDESYVINVLPGLGHAFSRGGPGARLDRSVLRWGVRRAASRPRSLTVFQQQSDQRVILGRGGRALRASRLIPGWGVDLTRFSNSGRPTDPPLVMMVSRMLWSKGVGDFVEAARLCRETTNVRFALVGDPDPGNPAPVPVGQLESWQQENVVEWWGRREDIPEVLGQAAIVALPSRYGEGVPQSLIEAAATGVPIVASDLPGCREVVEDRRNGILVGPGDVQELAQAVLRLVREPELRRQMGARGREIARERFATDRIVARYADVYREMGLPCSL